MDERVLVVEDDPDIVEILRLYLEGSGYVVLSAKNGADGLELLGREQVAVILTDIMMPVMNGFDFIKRARDITDAPIIILSARDQVSDKLVGLDSGADGYITKPFDPMEALAYVRAAIRRYGGSGPSDGSKRVLRAGDLEMDVDGLTLRKRGEVVSLTASELKIMAKLLSTPGRIFTKAQLYEAVTGVSYEGGEDSIMVHISNIRAKVEDDPSHPKVITTVRGLGYKIES